MRQRCVAREGSAEEHSLRFCPPDPVWAPAESLEKARKALKAFDPRLNLWWSPMRHFNSELPGRWRVVEFLAGSGTWDTVFSWEGPEGQYRPPLPVEPIIAKIASMDVTKHGGDLTKMSKALDAKNDKQDEKSKTAKKDDARRSAHDVAEFASNQKRTYAAAKVKASK